MKSKTSKTAFLTKLSLLAIGLLVTIQAQAAPYWKYKVLQSRPHEATLFTQGLTQDGNTLIESAGLYGRSQIVRYHVDNNTTVARRRLSNKLFAEGNTLFKGRLFLLTWRAQQALVLDPSSLQTLKSFSYRGQGWGLTHDNKHLIMSNGSATLTFRSAKDFKTVKSIQVTEGKRRWKNLNELEYAKGYIWANVWLTDLVLVIEPNSGKVAAKLDLSKLKPSNSPGRGKYNHHEQVLNGIAYDSKRDAFWVTGKHWDTRYLLKIEP